MIHQMTHAKTVILIAGHTTDNSGQHGSIGAGKTTIARALAEKQKTMEPVEVKSFAGLLRSQVRLSWQGIDWDQHLTGAVVNGFSYREIMESIANAYRYIDPMIYARHVCETMAPNGLTIIDDCRTCDEYIFTRRHCIDNRIQLVPVMLYRNVTDPVRQSVVEQSIHDLRANFFGINNNDSIESSVGEIIRARKRCL